MSIRRIVIVVGVLLVLATIITYLLTQGTSNMRSPLEPGEAAREFAALRPKLGDSPQAVSVSIGGDRIAVVLQDRDSPEFVQQWTVGHLVTLNGIVDRMLIKGPETIRTDLSGPSVQERAFDLTQIDFDLIPKIAQAALERAGLEKPGQVSAMTLVKDRVLRSPKEAGPLRWSISLGNTDETAVIKTDPSGRITAASLSGTKRAQKLDLLAGGQPLLDNVQAIEAAFADKEQLRELVVFPDRLSLRLLSAGPEVQPGIYISDLGGVSRNEVADLSSIPSIPGAQVPQPFTMHDIDWTQLAGFAQAARQIAKMPDAKVTSLTIRKVAHGAAAPTLELRFSLRGPGAADQIGTPPTGPSASVTLDNAGNVIGTR